MMRVLWTGAYVNPTFPGPPKIISKMILAVTLGVLCMTYRQFSGRYFISWPPVTQATNY